MKDPELLYKRACKIIKTNGNVSNAQEAWEIVWALKLLIEANKHETGPSPLKAKIIMAMASCHYKIGEMTLAYNCALIAQKEIDNYVFDSPFDDESARILLEEDECDEIIHAIQTRYPESVTELIEDYVLSAVDTTYLRKVFPLSDDAPFSRETILDLLGALNHLISMYYKKAESEQNRALVENSVLYVKLFKYPLLYVWQKYHFGRDEEVWQEDENMVPYDTFVSQIDKHLPELLSVLRTDSPFARIEREGKITKGLILVFSDLQNRITQGL